MSELKIKTKDIFTNYIATYKFLSISYINNKGKKVVLGSDCNDKFNIEQDLDEWCNNVELLLNDKNHE